MAQDKEPEKVVEGQFREVKEPAKPPRHGVAQLALSKVLSFVSFVLHSSPPLTYEEKIKLRKARAATAEARAIYLEALLVEEKRLSEARKRIQSAHKSIQEARGPAKKLGKDGKPVKEGYGQYMTSRNVLIGIAALALLILMMKGCGC